MPRPPRAESESGIYHVVNRGGSHQALFFSDADRQEFGRRLAAIHDDHGVVTLAYCLMGNHFHLLLWAPPGVLSDAMHDLTSGYAHYLNNRLGRDGPRVKGRFHSDPVETDSYLLWVTRYIHRNCLDIAGVNRPQDYRWSSLQAYLGERPAPRFVDTELVLAVAGGRAALAEQTFGDQPGTAPCDVARLARCAVIVDETSHDPAAATRRHLVRTLLLLTAARSSDPELTRIIERILDHSTAKAARQATATAEQRLRTDPAVARMYAWLERQLAA